ncbi:dTDP-4-amino-4,6-dideoxygalactose transaminase [Alkalihalobacillus xiaoxiensis]|uniref:dTDP-4-amino-4,6-dideoxygalactose transaminase n=1 Tax=Shouchella xiaoxiensis TaxID=766895 RepID=A0ABS2SVM4_9BACI|nr:DegT/DnrJ/EryC1/StrS family aminotransferase [Shouchella xiaoxiensis]MBM7838860.1 dTDP-4-amino-4,6-dideoxygalactose transaminase [Shouchella xiaoxiensis]
MSGQEKRTPIPMVDLQSEFSLLKPMLLKEIMEVLESGHYILGKKGQLFELRLADYVDAGFASGVANGTDALYIALKSLGIGAGDEVVTTPFTFFATGEVIAQTGATPVFADIESDTYNLDPKEIESKITDKTKAIIVVHLFGQAANMDAIQEIAKKHHLYVIEDACQAIGTEFKGERVGALGDIGCFSFFPSKSLGAFGDAGIIVTNQESLSHKVTQLRNHGSTSKYMHESIGQNSRLDEIQAAVLLVKLTFLDLFLHKRKEIAKRYSEGLVDSIKKPIVPNSRAHTFHQYCIELDERDQLADYLKQEGIASAVYYPVPLHLQKVFAGLGYKKGDFPVAEQAANRILALPISPELSIDAQYTIIECVNQFIKKG